MKRGKFQSKTVRHIRGSARSVSLILAVMLLIGCVVGGTVAWLVDETEAVVNTFTYGDINITLDEGKTDEKGEFVKDDQGEVVRSSEGNQYEMVPGRKLNKDPKVTVEANSEESWLFVKVEKAGDVDKFLTYAIADGWTELEVGVYYREVEESDKDQEFYVLAGDTGYENGLVTVKGTITKEDLEALETAEKQPALQFTAYAVQKENIATAAEAWAIANPTPAESTPVESNP